MREINTVIPSVAAAAWFVAGGAIGGAAAVIATRAGPRALFRNFRLLGLSGLLALGAVFLSGRVAPVIPLVVSVIGACVLAWGFVALVHRAYHLLRAGRSSPPQGGGFGA